MSNYEYYDNLAEQIIGAAIEVHRELGPGLLETVYELSMQEELRLRGLKSKCQVPVSVKYKTIVIEGGFRIDILVNDEFVVELKAVEKIEPIHKAQLITYLKLAEKPTGLLINFNSVLLKDGVTRLYRERKSG